MKKYIEMLSICMIGLVLFGACAKEESKEPEVETDGKAELLTYGFYKADNAGLSADYVVKAVESEMVIRLPEEVDKTKLVARFTATRDDLVLVGTVEQVSGKTANDFTYPVDYVVKDKSCGKSKTYTVKVGKILKKEWTEAGVFKAGGFPVSNSVMCVNQKDGHPYFFVLRKRMVGADEIEAGLVASYSDGVFTAGEEITFDADNKTVVEAKYPDIAADKDGNVYVAYYNYKSSSDFKTFVRKADGSSIGGPFCKTKNGQYIQIEKDPSSGHFICASYANSAVGSIVRRGLDLSYYKGGTWESENTIADFGNNEVHKVSTCVVGDKVYMGGQLTGKGKAHSYFIYKFDKGAWHKVINVLPDNMSGAAQLLPAPIAVAEDGTCYMLAGNDSKENGKWFITLMKCKDGKWMNVGSTIVDNVNNAPANKYSEFDLAIVNGQPIVVFLNQDSADKRYPCVLTWNEETKDWNEVIKLSDLPVKRGTLDMSFNDKGVGYISFVDAQANVSPALHLYKFDQGKDDLPE